MPTTIQVSEKLQKELAKRKIFEKETYEEVIWDLMEDSQELYEETKMEIAQARQEIREGKSVLFKYRPVHLLIPHKVTRIFYEKHGVLCVHQKL